MINMNITKNFYVMFCACFLLPLNFHISCILEKNYLAVVIRFIILWFIVSTIILWHTIEIIVKQKLRGVKICFFLEFLAHSHSINTLPSTHGGYVIPPEILSGQTVDGRMSSVRRFFCLFVTFDLAFTGLLWLICIMVSFFSFTCVIFLLSNNYEPNYKKYSDYNIISCVIFIATILYSYYGIYVFLY